MYNCTVTELLLENPYLKQEWDSEKKSREAWRQQFQSHAHPSQVTSSHASGFSHPMSSMALTRDPAWEVRGARGSHRSKNWAIPEGQAYSLVREFFAQMWD